MSLLNKFQSLLVLAAVVAGLALGQITGVGPTAGGFVVPFLMLMLAVVFLHVPLRGLGAAFRNLRFTGWCLGVNFIWTPILAWVLGRIFLADQPDLWVGLIMLLVTPCTDWYLVFTQLSGGNVRLGTSVLPWHLILQLALLPVYLLIFAGTLVPVELSILVESVLLVLIIPLVAATVIRLLAIRGRGEEWFERKLVARTAPLQLTFLLLAIAAMFASQGSTLLTRTDAVLRLLPPLLLFFAVNLSLGLVLGRRIKLNYGDCTAFCFATLARNSPVSLAIAVVAFPDKPLIALSLVIGPLIELPVLAVLTQVFTRAVQPRWKPTTGGLEVGSAFLEEQQDAEAET